MIHRFRLIAALLLAISMVHPADAQPLDIFEDEAPEFLKGLVGTYRADSAVATRVDQDLQFDWRSVPLDERIGSKHPFSATWSGYLQAKDNGTFRFKIFLAGEVKLQIADRLVLHAKSSEPEWQESKPIELSFGRHPILIEYQGTQSVADSRLSLFWTGPSFQLEPVTSRYLWHRFEESPQAVFGEGHLLSRGLRCAACHEFGNEWHSPAPLVAPSLTHLHGNLQPDWLVEHLSEQPPENAAPNLASRRMPYFGLDHTSALAISAALFEHSLDSPTAPAQSSKVKRAASAGRQSDLDEKIAGNIAQGATIFASVGCLGCHQLDGLGKQDALERQIFSGGDLSQIGSKRTERFFRRWLQDPAALNAAHRMPVFDLSSDEVMQLQTYLASLQSDAASTATDLEATGDSLLGGKLIREHRCGACHELPPALSLPIAKIKVDMESNWDRACLTMAEAQRNIPGFGLTGEQRQALQTYFEHTRRPADQPLGQQLLVESNCLGCHSRGLKQGIAPNLLAVATAHPELANRLAALSPPSLTGVGDKLRDAALEDAILRRSPALRPWLDIRMPKFSFEAKQASALADFFVGRDRIPDGGTTQPLEKLVEPQSDTSTRLAASRLVTSDGFGCQSCHQIGDIEAPQVDLKARGTNLEMLGERLRESWFHRWVRNPSRIVPRMEMPAVQTPVPGVLENDLDLQIDALWKVLNEPDFRPPHPNPVRIVRNHNLPDREERTKLVTGVFRTSHGSFVRPLVFGLPNRHNFLFDLEQGRLAAWWIGDVALQHTDGKTWYWEPGSPLLNIETHSARQENPKPARTDTLEQIQILDSLERIWRPTAHGQVVISLDSISHLSAGIRWHGRLHLAHQEQRREIPFQQLLTASGNTSIIETRVDLQPGETVLLETDATVTSQDESVVFSISSECQFEVQGLQSVVSLRGGLLHLSGQSDGENHSLGWSSTYRTEIPSQSFPIRPSNAPPAEPKILDCVPGYEVIQLPLPRAEMPIAFAWDEDGGEFFIGSLKGGVLQLIDSNADGLHDQYKTVSDHFPTPFGLHRNADGSLDVLSKFALLRLKPNAGEDPIRDAVVVADGWGYTDDYHDWAVGLEKDGAGNYWIALPCQQDDRSPEAAHLRGHAVKLVPNQNSLTNRLFRLESFAAGLRFPMGIALSPGGELFTTDNQGNYNPFNELNHIRSGKRYGFINKLENVDGYAPPFESPAINLPHPWSRSVNGICWLNTPPRLQDQGSNNHFGAFEGQLIGCEMNGRALIRMSLQKVGDTYQGAAYAFSRPNVEAQETFEGPIACDVAPNGDLYVGNLQDSGWGAGQNTGSIVRLRPSGELPPGIAAVTATSSSFVIRLTQSVDIQRARNPANYELRSYRRISTPAYGGDDQDERIEQAQWIDVSQDGMQITLGMPEFREGCVYEINLGEVSRDGSPLFPNQAHYTMRSIPRQ